MVFGFSAEGLGLEVQGFESRVRRLGCGVWGLGEGVGPRAQKKPCRRRKATGTNA